MGACSTARRQVTKPVFGNIDDWNVAWGTLCSKIVPTILVSVQCGRELGSTQHVVWSWAPGLSWFGP
jgi:hypothetical protein